MRARLRIAIVALVSTIVIALSALHLRDVIGETFDDIGERSRIVSDQLTSSLIEAFNRKTSSFPAADLDQRKAVWYDAVRTDPSIQRLLQKALVRTNSVVDVVIADADRRVLASAGGTSLTTLDDSARSWADWQKQALIKRLVDLYSSRADIVLDSPLGFVGAQETALIVRVSLSPVLLRQSVEPRLSNLAAVSLASLGLSALLAMLVSKLVGDSLERLGEKIDLIAQGDMKSVQRDRFESPEFMNLESKLWWLGRQYTGARSDILQLRSNVDQMLRKMDEAILVFGPDGRLQLAGEAAQRLLARSKDELLGRSLSELFPAWSGVGAVIDAAMGGRKSLRDHPMTLERPNMPSVRLIVNVESIEYDDGGACGVLVTMRDAETRQQLQADLDTARRLAAISRITSGVAHEIKNPLNAMTLHLEIANDKLKGDRDPSAELDIVKRELLRLDRVVKALLDFNRPFDVEMKQCDLIAIANDIALLVRPQADVRGVRVVVDHKAEQAQVVADPDLLRQAVLNVAVNAIEATPAGGTVGICVERGDHEHILSVDDTGPGIPAEIRDKIFNLYFTTKQSGTGVGLAMTYRIMQLHGGFVTVESEVGKGSRFRLGLPEREPEKAAA
jgi:hypothetical protein